jgi:hypothetical protein
MVEKGLKILGTWSTLEKFTGVLYKNKKAEKHCFTERTQKIFGMPESYETNSLVF